MAIEQLEMTKMKEKIGKRREMIIEIFLTFSALGWVFYLVKEVMGSPLMGPNPHVDVQLIVAKTFVVWMVFLVPGYLLVHKLGDRLERKELESFMSGLKDKMVDRRALTEELKRERGTEVRFERGLMTIENLVARYPGPLMDQLDSMAETLKQIMEAHFMLKAEVLSVNVTIGDERDRNAVNKWARKFFGENVPVNVAVGELKMRKTVVKVVATA